jgi:gag-polypeptide of LTR copia-type
LHLRTSPPCRKAKQKNHNSSSSHRIPRFHGKRGEDYGLWRLRLRAACRAKKLWSLVDPDVKGGSSISAAEKVAENKERACSTIIAALGDAPLRVVADVDDKPNVMLKLLDERYAPSRAASRIAIQTQLYRKTYYGSDMAKFIDEYCSLFSQLERMGKDAAIPETHKAPMLLAAIPVDSPLEVTAAALRTKDVAELICEFSTTTLIDETDSRSMRTSGNNGATSFRGRRNNKYLKQSNSNRSDNNEFHDVDAAARAFDSLEEQEHR